MTEDTHTETEKLKFKIVLSGTHPEKKAEFRISLGGKQIIHTNTKEFMWTHETFEFEEELVEGNQFLEIEFLNKATGDTILDEQGNMLSDHLLNIESIEVDDVDLGPLKWTLSEYHPRYPAEYVADVLKDTGKKPDKIIKNCVNMGWNGRWVLPFQSPFYLWLLENV